MHRDEIVLTQWSMFYTNIFASSDAKSDMDRGCIDSVRYNCISTNKGWCWTALRQKARHFREQKMALLCIANWRIRIILYKRCFVKKMAHCSKRKKSKETSASK